MMFFILTYWCILAYFFSLTFLPNFSTFWYYLPFVGALLFNCYSNDKIRVRSIFVFFLISIYFSIITNQIDPIFHSSERYLSFLILITLLTPLLSSTKLNRYRLMLFKRLNFLFKLLVLGSLVAFLFNIKLNGDRADFSGLFTHSMVFGPVAAISCILLLNDVLLVEKPKVISLILILVMCAACLTAGSRAAVIALFCAILYFIVVCRKDLRNAPIRNGFVAFLFLGAMVLIWKVAASDIIGKTLYSLDQSGLMYSRETIWSNRIDEFKSSPLFGIGFCSVNKNISGNFDAATGIVEPGSSWLAVLSMTGILSLAFFTGIIWRSLKNLKRYRSYRYVGGSLDLVYFESILVFFAIHLLFEGYVLSSGNSLFLYFWLVIGVIEIKTLNQRSEKIFWKRRNQRYSNL